MADRPPRHPGRTPAQRRVLDLIGCGNHCPPMARATRKALLDAGLINQLEDATVGRDRFGPITIPQYDMPIAVHMDWCAAVGHGVTDEELNDAAG